MKNSIISLAMIAGTIVFSGCGTTSQTVAPTPQKSIDAEYSNPTKGKKFYSKYIYKTCGITCNTMAKKHTQDEWEKFQLEGNTMERITDICPIVDDLKPKVIRAIYDYMYSHASDSGNVAACKD